MIFIKFKFTISLFLILTINLLAQTQNDLDKSILKGLDHSYHFRWDKAEEIFQDIIEKYPERPEGYHFLSSIYAWYYLSSKNENDLDTFVTYSDIALNKGSKELEENPLDEHLNFIIGSNYSYRAIVFASAESYLSAVWAGKKSDSYLSDALGINPEFFDAYLGLGLFNFAAGQTPGAFKWALKLAGISGNKEEGINHIRLAAEKGNYSKIEAQYYYSQVSPEDSVASDFLTSLVKKYPENILFKYSLASLNIKQRKLNAAEKMLRKIINKDEEKFALVISFSNFLLGDVLFKKNEFDSSIVYYKKFLETTPDNDYTGIASFRLGISYEVTGERNNAKIFFDMCDKGNMDLDDDIFAKRKGAVYFVRKLSENEIAVIKASNLIDSGNYKAAYDSLTGILDNIVNEKLKAETYLYLSEAAYHLGKYNQSISFASAALKTEVLDEKWILPYANYFAARANYILGDELAVNYFIEQVEEFNDYDYQNKMKNLLYTLKQKMLL